MVVFKMPSHFNVLGVDLKDIFALGGHMPKVRFISENLEVDVPIGTPLSEAVNKAGSAFPFGCRRGSCGTCRCFVVAGMDHLNKKTEHEDFLFATLTYVEPHERLGCQLIVNGDIEIEV